jgi:hypothetical protein
MDVLPSAIFTNEVVHNADSQQYDYNADPTGK